MMSETLSPNDRLLGAGKLAIDTALSETIAAEAIYMDRRARSALKIQRTITSLAGILHPDDRGDIILTRDPAELDPNYTECTVYMLNEERFAKKDEDLDGVLWETNDKSLENDPYVIMDLLHQQASYIVTAIRARVVERRRKQQIV